MKKYIFTIGLFSALLTPATFAYISGKIAKEEEFIYCPKQIQCSQRQYLTEVICTSLNDYDAKYFQISSNHRMPIPQHQTGTERIFILQSVLAGFHSRTTEGQCTYVLSSEHSTPSDKIFLEIKPETILEASTKKPSAWVFSGNSSCDTSNPILCPLKRAEAFLIKNINIPEGVIASVNKKDISTSIRISKEYTKIIFDDLLEGCGSEKRCAIDLSSSKHALYGSLIVDMDTMEILEVKSLYPSKIKVTKMNSYNIVEIEYL